MIPGWQTEAYERLRTAILKSAVFDLQKAMRRYARLGFVCDEQTKLEAWFLSEWGQMLSGGNGEYIVERCRKTYKPRNAPRAERRISHADYINGVKYKTIMQKYNISSTTIYNIVRRWQDEAR